MSHKDKYFQNKTMINFSGKLVDISKPLVMGILNCTPDSFFDGGKNNTEDLAIQHAGRMINEGADIIDIGGMSTKPNSKLIDAKEELSRVLPIIKKIKKAYPDQILSIDTYRSEVADAAINEGVSMVNDISAGMLDNKLWAVVKKYNAPYVLMHMKGTPQNMQDNPTYEDVVEEVMRFLSEKVNALNQFGINDVVIDLGFGFGKKRVHNYTLLKNLDIFRILNKPILVGISRKSMIYRQLDTTVEDALNGTTVLNTFALTKGANILRVHDVKEAKETIKLMSNLI